MNNISTLSTIKGDKEIAEDLRKKLYDALQPIVGLIAEADQNGFEVGFAFGKDAFGKTAIQQIHLSKRY